MIYPHTEELERLIADRLVSKRPHPTLPLFIYNYTAKAVTVPPAQWSAALSDARGLIMDEDNRIVGRPFSKFWNYEQVLDQIPANEDFEVWEKLDGSLGIVCNYLGNRVVATRGSFESDQAKWAAAWLDQDQYAGFLPSIGQTFLFEILFPENRIVVDYGNRAEMVLLGVIRNSTGLLMQDIFDFTTAFSKAKRFDGIKDHGQIPEIPGEEGFVVRWRSGFLAKVKFAEYKRLHRLITQCSTRTIWEFLRDGKSFDELMDRVPEDFKEWATTQITGLNRDFALIRSEAQELFESAPVSVGNSRKEFAEWAKQTKYPSLLFAQLDGKSLDSMIWKMVEPQWSTPFRCGGDE